MTLKIEMVASPARLIEMMGPYVSGVEDEGQLWVVLKSLCDSLGLNWSGERSRLKHDPKFTLRRISLMGSHGKGRDMLCLPWAQLNGWLFSINAERVREACQERLRLYQQASLVALSDYWAEAEAPAIPLRAPRVVESLPEPEEAEVTLATLEDRVVHVMKDLLDGFAGRSPHREEEPAQK